MNLAGIGSFITSLVPLIVALLAHYAARKASLGQNHDKRLAIIDLTQKRLALRDELLKLELAAAKGAGEERQAKERAQLAIQRIVSDADSLIKELEWKAQLNLAMSKKPHHLEPALLDGTRRLRLGASWIAAIVIALAASATTIWFAYIQHKHISDKVDLIVFLVAIVVVPALFLAAGHFRHIAYSIRFSKPDGPILDEI